ncbi:MAG: PQQ-like beta-propeller repeat protein [Thermoplasmata archaeon]|nr:PQQ-like beta-propeller repeat protein [Thermoplasmata archaeon]
MVRYVGWKSLKVIAPVFLLMVLHANSTCATNFMINPQHTGRIPYKGPRATAERFRLELGERVVMVPIYADGKLYVGTMSGNLYCLSEKLSVIWKTNLGGKILASPFCDSFGHVFVGTTAGHFYCLDSDGSVVWKLPIGEAVVSSPVGNDSFVYFGTWDGRLICVALSGRVMWEYYTGYIISGSPAIDHEGNVVVPSMDGNVYSLTPEGELRWIFETADSVAGSPSIDSDNNIYFGSYDGFLYALSSDGQLRWKFKTRNQIYSTPAIGSDGTLYFTSVDRTFYAVSDEGTLKWSRPNGVCLGSVLIDAEGNLYVHRSGRAMTKYSPEGETILEFYANQGDSFYVTQAAIGENGVLYHVSVNGVVIGIGDLACYLESTIDLGKSLHGIKEWRDGLLALDWWDGTLYFIDLTTYSVSTVASLPHILCDFAVEDNLLYAGWDPSAEGVRVYDLASRAYAYTLHIQGDMGFINNELWGIEKGDHLLYLIGTGKSGQRFVIYNLEESRVVLAEDISKDCGVHELIGLEIHNGNLYTFDWPAGVIFRLSISDSSITLSRFKDMSPFVPTDVRAPGGFRGFHFGKHFLYLTSVSGGAFSRLHLIRYPEDFWEW